MNFNTIQSFSPTNNIIETPSAQFLLYLEYLSIFFQHQTLPRSELGSLALCYSVSPGNATLPQGPPSGEGHVNNYLTKTTINPEGMQALYTI